jgi:hypothetical protein
MRNKYEQLIEYVINDEAEKARELFHDIVVETSRHIYEDLMDIEEECTMGGDSSDKFIDDVEADEEGIQFEGEDEEEIDFDVDDSEGPDFDDEEVNVDFDDEGDEEGISSEKVMDLEDKLDALMAEFEALMSDSDEEFDSEEDVDFDVDGGDELAVDDTEEFDELDEESTHTRDERAEKAGRKVAKDIEWDEKHHRFDENISLSAAPKPVTTEPAGTNTKSINANNSGAIGAEVHPVKMTGDTAHGRSNPKVGELIGKVQNTPASGDKKLSPATKPDLKQAAGVNTRTPFPKA